MTKLTTAYLGKHAVYFEPEDEQEVRAIQSRLIDLGYSWGMEQRTVSYVQKCVAEGITALPNGRMFIGIPADHNVTRHTYEELNGEPLLRAAVDKLSNSVSQDAKAIDDLRVDIKREVSSLRSDMFRQFENVSYRQKKIEDNQAVIMAQLEQVLALLQPRVDLDVKKPVIGKKP